jgi:hypothetical protein
VRILTAAVAGNGTAFVNASTGQYKNRRRTLYVYGTFGGTTVTLQISPDGTNWFTVAGISITVQGVVGFEENWNYCRGVVTGGAGMAIDAVIL